MTEHTARPLASAGKTADAMVRKFERLGLRQPMDFVLHLPLRYEDETRITSIACLRAGAWAQVEGDIVRSEIVLHPRRQLTAGLADESGELGLRWLHFYPSLHKSLQVGKRLRARGEVRHSMFGLEMIHPRLTLADTPLPDALTPVYPTTDGLTQPSLRRAIAQALTQADLSECLPDAVLQRYGLSPFDQAIRMLHAPDPGVSEHELVEKAHPAWLRIKFDELLAQQLSLAAARAARREKRALALPRRPACAFMQRLLATLPFALTGAQQRVVEEISADLENTHPMHRLLQGDVGSGKTVVAALAAAQAIDNGVQVALMAPTEILAEQHFRRLAQWLEPLGITVAWLVGSLSAKTRRDALARVAEGTANLVVGTQALIQECVNFSALGLVIVDEQHRFGVGQRLALSRKGYFAPSSQRAGAADREEGADGGLVPHQLNMSATPIPRTLAMTFFADLDVSVIDELPPGRAPIRTKLVNDARRAEVIERVAQAARQGRQAYWVCPLVEESETLALQTAVDTHQTLCQELPDLRLGLVHGRLTPIDKAGVMQAFRDGELDLLVATTVIEVGVDVPNASLMVVEHAERFGLAQLHQLRGRVGRGSDESVCVLLYQHPLSSIARDRLRAMYETCDGFEIARRDLEQRGPGEFLGLRQSGMALLRFADLTTDARIAEQAREAAALLRQHHPEAVRMHLARWLRGREDYLRT